jgi:hypothetical protein
VQQRSRPHNFTVGVLDASDALRQRQHAQDMIKIVHTVGVIVELSRFRDC